MTNKRLDLTGQIIGQWSVGERVVGKHGKSYFKCKCLNCGTKRTVKGSALISGASASCGCMAHGHIASEKRKKTLAENKVFIDGTSTSIIRKLYSGELLSNNKSGCTGVSQKGGSWIAEIRFQGKYHYLGSYRKYSDAVRARRMAEEEYFGKVLKDI